MIGRDTPSKYILHKLGDPTHDGVKKNIHRAIDSLDPGKAWTVEIKQYRKTRTSAANRYLWGVCYATLVTEQGHEPEDWHEYVCIQFFGGVKRALPGGEFETVPIRTTTKDENGNDDTLAGAEFWRFVEHLRRIAAEGGVYIADPQPWERDEIEREWRK